MNQQSAETGTSLATGTDSSKCACFECLLCISIFHNDSAVVAAQLKECPAKPIVNFLSDDPAYLGRTCE
jgi:hypothetical protein